MHTRVTGIVIEGDKILMLKWARYDDAGQGLRCQGGATVPHRVEGSARP